MRDLRERCTSQATTRNRLDRSSRLQFRAFIDKSDPGVRQSYRMNLQRQRGRDSGPVLKVLAQPKGIVNRRMDVPAGDGITDTIEQERTS